MNQQQIGLFRTHHYESVGRASLIWSRWSQHCDIHLFGLEPALYSRLTMNVSRKTNSSSVYYAVVTAWIALVTTHCGLALGADLLQKRTTLLKLVLFLAAEVRAACCCCSFDCLPVVTLAVPDCFGSVSFCAFFSLRIGPSDRSLFKQ